MILYYIYIYDGGITTLANRVADRVYTEKWYGWLVDTAFERVQSDLEVLELLVHLLHLFDQQIETGHTLALLTQPGEDALDVPIDASDLVADGKVLITHW